MGCRTLVDRESGQACFYCSTTDWAFGPIFSSYEAAELFLAVYAGDPRNDTDKELRAKFYDFTNAYVCECGGLRDADNADSMATAAHPEGCTCLNNGEDCDWCEAKKDVLENWAPEAGERFECYYCWRKKQPAGPKEIAEHMAMRNRGEL